MPWEALCTAKAVYGPVTTDPLVGEAAVLSDPVTTVAGMTNLWLRQDAGSQLCSTDLPSYISGFCDGEGCFTVSISPRSTLSVGWEVRPGFSVSQNGDRAEVLLEIQHYFGCGRIRPDRSDKTVKWEVRGLGPLLSAVIPHFVSYPLRSGKQRDVELFTDICQRMAGGEHRTTTGLRSIMGLAVQMNPSGIRRYGLESLDIG
jgi:hypothetical protein